MSSKKEMAPISAAVVKSFKSPVFLAIAICFSVITLISLISIIVAFNIITLLSFAFATASTVCAWLLYAARVSRGALKNLRLHVAYSKVMTTISIVLVSIIGGILIIACIALTIVSDIVVDELIPMLEEDVKPMLEEVVENAELAEDELGDFEDAFEDMPQELKDIYGLESAEDFKQMVMDFKGFAQNVLDSWDDIIGFLETGFLPLTILVSVVFVLVIVALAFVSKALKKTSKFIKAFAKDNNTDKKAPYILLFIGGGIIAFGGICSFAIDPLIALSTLAQGAVLVLFAIFFKQMIAARDEELAAVAADTAEADAPAEEAEAPAEEETVSEQ